ncbi:LacI family DNA-binding transcriptional regulator [Microlunatus parietis]|uniref:DNA-binding LacI/PurR family transcriptional regulator n=1 Tax=Microlunatus parietis TaxID=682979 RepID=A0A7Y9IF67_9ACTN|nr:substrate-binding domain-containing protein [Microlunatus parietis]NYE75516.1 DNA-binding LacI/PurR family transcriptional regulator [Microlunatus parietis]
MTKPTKRRRGPSLAEVAELAGVSISTVSKVANNSPDVAEQTRTKVAGILSEQRYVAPRQRRAGGPRIGLLVRSMRLPNTIEPLRGAMERAAVAGMPLEVLLYRPRPGWIDDLQAHGIRGLVAISSVLDAEEREQLAEAGIALVVVNPLGPPHVGHHSVGATDWAGGYAAADHLLGLGHRRFGVLRGDDRSMVSQSRASGNLAALTAADIEPESIMTEPGDFTFEAGLDAALRLLARPDRPTAICAASDFQALGVIEAARQLGLRVPDDVSAVGFDDLVLASMSSPPLTTVRQPLDQLGAVAVGMLTDLIAGVEPESHHLELATSLVVRSSTAAPSKVRKRI